MLTSTAARWADRGTRALRSAMNPIAFDSPDKTAMAIDANGSPVTVEAATWLVCFVPGLRRQWWHMFADRRHKHVFALRPLDDGSWLLMEPWWTRMMVNVLTLDQAIRFLRWGAMGDVLKVRERIPGRGSQMRGWANCSVLVSYMLGRSYWTWTPNGLFRRLKDEPDVESVSVAQFVRRHVLAESQRHSRAALASVSKQRGDLLRDILLELGTSVVATMTSRSGIGLYRAAVSEIVRDREVADAYRSGAPDQAIERVRKVLVAAKFRGEIDVDDCTQAARRFVAMLKGQMHLEVALGLRESPTHGEVRDHVACVVDVFLYGAHRARSAPPVGVRTQSATQTDLTAQSLIREIGESLRETVRGDDWDAVAGWAEALWSDYVGCTGLSWEQASGRIRRAWETSRPAPRAAPGENLAEPFRFGSCGETRC
ncbi:TetR/AcrR family transcriptional regulator C-terminal domain-containing protein [Lysobacter soli]|uniref:TetR/AcrR family transcriptional regulator C-terminal domain-containing protein n=1 Tax=Lysobacter soli TaxID=453783 RepID=UPI00240F0BD6|nr:TetR/AcrR family transcriptional regulator C-terminal domain-containing protein [Lysobacter soli]MDG2519375.1 TetR/AcrR family transcriptional regulator C-terminal domain-containing protein [Lysobacter soli]